MGDWRLRTFVAPLGLAFLVGLALACASATSTPEARVAAAGAGPHADLESRAFVLVNAHRRGLGLASLVSDSDLAERARGHSTWMAGRGELDHSGFEQRYATSTKGFPAARFAENLGLAIGTEQSPADSTVARWLAEAAHRKNAEGPYDRTGVGVARSEEGVFYFTQLFLGVESTKARP